MFLLCLKVLGFSPPQCGIPGKLQFPCSLSFNSVTAKAAQVAGSLQNGSSLCRWASSGFCYLLGLGVRWRHTSYFPKQSKWITPSSCPTPLSQGLPSRLCAINTESEEI